MALNVASKKKPLAYVPWVALGAFVVNFVGMIVWATGATKALTNTDNALNALTVQVGGYIDYIHSVTIGAVVATCIMSAVMVLMSGGRTCIEKAVDERGKAVCGSWLWLAVEAVLCAVWWLILFWLVFVIFGSCLWYGAAYTVRGVLRTSINTANQFNNMTETAKANSNLTAFSPPPPASGNMTLCGQGCLNLALFDFLVQQEICVCKVASMTTALNYTNKAYDALGSVVAGAFLLWVGSSWLLMNAVADFAKMKRERELLLRAQRAAAEGAASQLALGTANGNPMYAPYTQDNLPLLQAQALQQQQLQMQMQMMAQAQAMKVGPPPQVAVPSASAVGTPRAASNV